MMPLPKTSNHSGIKNKWWDEKQAGGYICQKSVNILNKLKSSYEFLKVYYHLIEQWVKYQQIFHII